MVKPVAQPEWPNPNELMFRKVDREWTPEELLAQRGWFPLADVMKKLDPQGTGKYRKILSQREKLIKIHKDTTSIMGLKPFGKRLWADMPVFGQWLHKNDAFWLDRIPKSWNFQTFLKQKKGTFSLNRVLQLMPPEISLRDASLIDLIHEEKDPQYKLGAGKLKGVGYVVFMPRFGEWLKRRLS